MAGPFGHGLQLLPHELTSVLVAQVALHRCVPVLQVKSQLTPLQVALPLTGGVQGVHELAPHELTERFETHAPLQPCAPVLQVKPHDTPSQLAVEFAGGLHAEQAEPHELVEAFETHALPQR